MMQGRLLKLLSTLVVVVPAVTATGGSGSNGLTYELPPLPFGMSALKPMIGKRTLEIHHGKHHAKYVNTLNELVKGTTYENQSLEKIMKTSYKATKSSTSSSSGTAIFNNAAQAWNHSFYWKCLTPKGGGTIPTKHELLYQNIVKSFGSYDEFRTQFTNAANTAFGSGWAWLVTDRKGHLSVMKTIGADNPLVTTSSGGSSTYIPILTIDVWEHAYYLDYANLRPSYVNTFLDKLVNWDYVAENLNRAMNSGRVAEI